MRDFFGLLVFLDGVVGRTCIIFEVLSLSFRLVLFHELITRMNVISLVYNLKFSPPFKLNYFEFGVINL